MPYWWVDAGAAVQTLLLGAVGAGLGACLFGLFSAEAAVLGAHGVPDGWRAAGTVALGRPSAEQRPGPLGGPGSGPARRGGAAGSVGGHPTRCVAKA